MRRYLCRRNALLLLGCLVAGCETPQYALRAPGTPSTQPEAKGPSSPQPTAPHSATVANATADPRAAQLQEALQKHSFERVICPEDIGDATVRFTHFADEEDALEDDYYETTGQGIVLGIQDSQYVIFTTRCAVDFEWPNHEIRWRNIHGFEDGPPELRNEGLIFHGTSTPSGGDEFFTCGGTNLLRDADVSMSQQVLQEHQRRRNTLAEARKVGDTVTIDRFPDGKGQWSDVALVYVPIHRDSTIKLRDLGLTKPKDAVRSLLAKQGVLFGMDFEFSCPECQKIVAGYQSRELQAFALGFGLGLLTGVALEGMVQRLLDVDTLAAKGGNLATTRLDPLRRIANAGLRRQILERDGFTCVYAKFGMCDPKTCWACIAKNLHIDHVLAFSRGGKTVPENLVSACAACNMSKGYELLSTWMQAAGQ
jgi:hypothetical protein